MATGKRFNVGIISILKNVVAAGILTLFDKVESVWNAALLLNPELRPARGAVRD